MSEVLKETLKEIGRNCFIGGILLLFMSVLAVIVSIIILAPLLLLKWLFGEQVVAIICLTLIGGIGFYWLVIDSIINIYRDKAAEFNRAKNAPPKTL